MPDSKCSFDGDVPLSIALTKSASFHSPIPSRLCGEIFGTRKVPKSDRISRPPPSRIASSWSGVAWQDAQPPAKNIVRPLSGLPLYGGRTEAGTVSGRVRPSAIGPPSTIRMKIKTIRRPIHPAPLSSPS